MFAQTLVRPRQADLAPRRPAEVPMIVRIEDEARFDAQRYLAANPDVARTGVDPRAHYIHHGRSEGRRQIADPGAFAALRAAKLSRIAFRTPPTGPAAPGGALDYLPDWLRVSLEIPEFPPVAENDYAAEIVAEIRANPDHLFLDVGAGFRHVYYENVVNAEIWAAPSTDVICIGEDLPFADAQFDHVFCLAVLEHTKRPWVAVEEILRVLKPGGLVRIDWPFLQPVHGYPHHYFNATSKGTISQFEETCDILSAEIRPWQHPIFSLAWMLDEWRAGLTGETRKAFEAMRVADFGTNREILLRQPFCQELSPATQDVISAGTTLIARKR